MSEFDPLQTDRLPPPGRVAPVALALLVLLLVPACKSGVETADAYEAAYDRQLGRGRYPDALRSIGKSVQNDENEPRRWLKLAHLHDLLNHPADAANAYQRALDLQPYNVEALENLAILNVRAGQYATAKRYIDPLLLLQPSDLAGLLASGALALHEKRFADAEKFAARIIANAPASEEGHILHARIFELTGRDAAAAKLLEERQALDPDSRDVATELLTVYRRMANRAGVRRIAIRLMALFPDDPRYALESVRAYHAMNRDGDAHRILAELTTRYAGNTSVMIAIAGLRLDIEPRATALDEIVATARQAPKQVRAALADFLTNLSEPARAVDLLAPIAAAPVDVGSIDLQAAYARALFALGRSAEVQRKVDAILAFDGINPTGLLLRARLAYARGDFQKAATDAGVVASDDDSNEEAALLVAQIYAAQGNRILASKAFADAHDGFPDSPTVVRAQTQWLLSQGRAKDATDIAASFAHARRGQSAAWLVYRDICAAAGNAKCLAEARAALAALSS